MGTIDDGDYAFALRFVSADSPELIDERDGRACSGRYLPPTSTSKPTIIARASDHPYEIADTILHELIEHYDTMHSLHLTHRATIILTECILRTLRNSPEFRRYVVKATRRDR